jgi:hypothetical protein
MWSHYNGCPASFLKSWTTYIISCKQTSNPLSNRFKADIIGTSEACDRTGPPRLGGWSKIFSQCYIVNKNKTLSIPNSSNSVTRLLRKLRSLEDERCRGPHSFSPSFANWTSGVMSSGAQLLPDSLLVKKGRTGPPKLYCRPWTGWPTACRVLFTLYDTTYNDDTLEKSGNTGAAVHSLVHDVATRWNSTYR